MSTACPRCEELNGQHDAQCPYYINHTNETILEELDAIARELCDCEYGGVGPHGYMCPTRRIIKRLNRLEVLWTSRSS